MLDALLDEYKPTITQHMYARFSAQHPTYMQGILLEMYAAAVFNVGLMLEQAGNDSKLSHLFPSDLTVCLTGRGGWLLDSLTPQQRNNLQRIGHEPMQLRHPVHSLTIRLSPLPALGTALGMAVIKETGVTNDTPVIRTRQSFSELMRMLMTLLFQCYPMHMWMLHPGLFDEWGNLTPAGGDTIRRVAIAMYEGEINMVIHANGGSADLEIYADYIKIILADTGPGIPNIDLAMQEGFSTAPDNIRSLGFGAGMGLPNMKRYTDEMQINTEVGVGTTVTMRVNIA